MGSQAADVDFQPHRIIEWDIRAPAIPRGEAAAR